MRRVARLFVPLTIAAATVVTALLAAPPAAQPSGFIGEMNLQRVSIADAASMMQRTAVIASLLTVWILAAIVLTLMSGREIRYSSVEVRSSPLHCFALGLVAV